MNTWRPEGWENPYKKPIREGVVWNKEEVTDAYEVGADDILEALKKQGEYVKEDDAYCSPCGGCFSNEDCVANETGWVIFIPDK